jgi:hypothetical protein
MRDDLDQVHGHGDGQAHGHSHTKEQQPPPGISVVLDIGGEVGALVVHLASVPPGGELEARPQGDDSRRLHTGVHLRPSDQGDVLVAVFPEVLAGAYELLDVKGAADAQAIAEVTVHGGQVTELDLR